MNGLKIFKFGGASVKDAAGVRNLAGILRNFPKMKIVVVVSAMGKITNSLEHLTDSYFRNSPQTGKLFSDLKEFHHKILVDLFNDDNHPAFTEVNNTFAEMEWILEEKPGGNFDFVYDQLVPAGEMLSTKIVSAYLDSSGIKNRWLDARDIILTDNSYREGKINWEATEKNAAKFILPILEKNDLIVTQGFIGSTTENYTTTLGREGSDYTASILAYCLDAEEVCIWKDVPGVLNADPKFFGETQKLEKVTYGDAVELAYYGASVIHPKTIQPLQNKNIPLRVKSFLSPAENGTLISAEPQVGKLIPSYIFKDNQVLISVSAKDFSFIAEEHLSDIFSVFAKEKIKINLMQNSAISFSFCFDHSSKKTNSLVEILSKNYKVLYNENLQLFTIRHYDQATIEKLTAGREILVEQKSRHTIQFLVK